MNESPTQSLQTHSNMHQTPPPPPPPPIPTEIISEEEMALILAADPNTPKTPPPPSIPTEIISEEEMSLILAADPNTPKTPPPPSIPTEIISDEEMAIIEAALASTGSALSPSTSAGSRNTRSLNAITLLSKRKLSIFSSIGDIEDAGKASSPEKKAKRKVNSAELSLLRRFRQLRGLSVSDITRTEWCEKQMEYTLLLGLPEKTEAMKVGSARHAALEEEVVKRIRVEQNGREDEWALRFWNFIVGANQLRSHGLTRELPL